MEIYTNYPEKGFAKRFTKLLVEAIEYQDQHILLISPWLKDVCLPVSPVGHFASLLGGQREEINLAELLGFIAERNKLIIVTKPPNELIPFENLKLLLTKLELKQRFEEEEDFVGYDIVPTILEEIRSSIDVLIRTIVTHLDTLTLGKWLQGKGGQLFYLEKLHAKLLFAPTGVFVGSANFTNGGLFYNEEIMLEFSDECNYQKFEQAGQTLLNRAIAAKEYSLTRIIEKFSLSIDDIKFLSEHSFLERYSNLRQLLSFIVEFT